MDVLIGYPMLKDLGACIHLGEPKVKMVVNGKCVSIWVGYDSVEPFLEGADTDIKDFTSDVNNHDKDYYSSIEGTFCSNAPS